MTFPEAFMKAVAYNHSKGGTPAKAIDALVDLCRWHRMGALKNLAQALVNAKLAPKRAARCMAAALTA